MIRIGREIQCLPYAGFFFLILFYWEICGCILSATSSSSGPHISHLIKNTAPSSYTPQPRLIPGEPPTPASSPRPPGLLAKPCSAKISSSKVDSPKVTSPSPPPPPYLSWRSYEADKRWGCLKPAGGSLKGGAPQDLLTCKHGCGKELPRSQHRKLKAHASSCPGPKVASPDLSEVPVSNQVKYSTHGIVTSMDFTL